MSNTQQVARVILQQLGGQRFIAMTGASSFSSGPDVLTFRLPKNPKGVKAVRIVLDPSDTYTLETLRQRPFPDCTVETVKKVSGIYCDMLQTTFTELTGLYTRL